MFFVRAAAMIFRIEPSIGCVDLPFGLPRAEVKARLPGRVKSPSRTPNEDYFPDAGLFALFDGNDRLNAVEFFEPAEVWLGERQMLGMTLSQAKRVLAAAGGEVVDDDAGVTCPNIGIGLYVPAAREFPDDPVETVIVFNEGCYGEG